MSARTAIILAGGRSSRMGTAKALLPFDGEPLIVHIVRTLQPLFDDIAVVAAPDQQVPAMPVRLVRDDVPHQGPVGGIYYGLKSSGGECSFVTSCDSAFLDPRLVAHLVDSIHGHDVVVPRWQERLQPLVAVYRTSVLPHLDAQLARGELRPVYLFDKVRSRIVEEDEIRRFDPDGLSFFNMNTPADYDDAVQRWRSVRARSAPGDPFTCTIELFGVARLLARTASLSLTLPAGATFQDAFALLAQRLPMLRGRVISADGRGLLDGYACNVDGLAFVRNMQTPISPGTSIVILSADAGG